MDEYKRYLADKIISEEQVITYRYLSRALKVHVNEAKQMLYDFHRSQNARKHGSIHATYLLYGIRRPEQSASQAQDDGDIEMPSSMPETESIAEQAPTYTMSLVREEDLNGVVAQYDEVSSVHVYSISPHPLKDLQMLADTARQVLELSAGDGATASLKTFGTITNPHVRRRESKGGVIPKPAAAVGPAPTPAKKAEAKPAAASSAKLGASAAPVKQENQKFVAAEPKPADVKATPEAPATKKPTPSLKRNASSGIMQAFAKGAAAKPKKKEPAAPAEDTHMALSDDGEDDSEVAPKPKVPTDNRRKRREEELRRMMDDDDEEEASEPEEREDTPMEEAEPVVEEAAQAAPIKEEPPEEVSASAGDGRRRGRRKVMKKKQIMDEEGFLVTIQEPGWESFSEDETPASEAKPAASASTAASSGAAPAKPKKTAQKGQGNIMSFFSKK